MRLFATRFGKINPSLDGITFSAVAEQIHQAFPFIFSSPPSLPIDQIAHASDVSTRSSYLQAANI